MISYETVLAARRDQHPRREDDIGESLLQLVFVGGVEIGGNQHWRPNVIAGAAERGYRATELQECSGKPSP
jgi:hypothetical protein